MQTDIKTGLKPACTVKKAKQTNLQSLLQDNLSNQMVGSWTYTLIILDHCQEQMIIIYLPSSIGSQDGLSPSPWEIFRQKQSPKWIAFFNCPSIITTDRGSQFQSTLFDEFTKLLGVKHIKNNSANGLINRFHRQLKMALTAINNSRT